MSVPWGRKRACINADKSGQGEGGSLAVNGHPSHVGHRTFKGHLIIIFLCGRLENKEGNKKLVLSIVLQLSVFTDMGEGFYSKSEQA